MNTLLIILAFVCLAVGIVATFTPVPPAVPVAWAGLLLARIGGVPISTQMLIWTAVIGVALMVLDYVIPLLTTKRFGGTKFGVWGCTIGLLIGIIGLPIGPSGIVGIFFWPFAGAFIGEYIKQHELRPALRSAWGAFVGMLTGSLAKVAYGITLTIILIIKIL